MESLEKNLKLAWESIDENILESLVSSMPSRMKLVIENRGDYISK